MENTENWVEKYKERMDKNKPSETDFRTDETSD